MAKDRRRIDRSKGAGLRQEDFLHRLYAAHTDLALQRDQVAAFESKQAGLLVDAEREFGARLAANPHSRTARKLLREIQVLRH